MLVGASSSLSFFFLDFGTENNIVPYFYYILLDLFPLVLFVWVVKWKEELHEKVYIYCRYIEMDFFSLILKEIYYLVYQFLTSLLPPFPPRLNT